MGSVAFAAPAGQVTDIGRLGMQPPAAAPEKGDSSAPIVSAGSFITPSSVGAATDPRLSAVKVTPARLRPIGKLPNYMGITIGRIPAIPGVMRYDRDQIIDLTGGN